MNRQQRRAMGAPAQENHRVQVSIEDGYAKLTMIGMTSRVAVHVMLEPSKAYALGWALIKTAFKTWWKR
jgi:hypothetical protein